MKLCVINFSGNVGKTTIAAHLLKPRMNDPQVFSVESFNSGIENEGVEDAEIIKGKRNRIQRQELVELNSADAAAWAIVEGDEVEVHTQGGNLTGQVRVVDSVPTGVVSVTSLFGQLAVDLQDSQDPDPASKVPGLDIRPARVVKAGANGSGYPVRNEV